jgi:hypothetical protein
MTAKIEVFMMGESRKGSLVERDMSAPSSAQGPAERCSPAGILS